MEDRALRYLTEMGVAEEQLGDWKVEVAQRAGKDVALVLTRGTEIHLAPLGPGAMSRRNTLQFIRPIFDEYGFVTTRTPRTVTDHKLRLSLGFEFTFSDDQFDYWAMTELPFQRSKT